MSVARPAGLPAARSYCLHTTPPHVHIPQALRAVMQSMHGAAPLTFQVPVCRSYYTPVDEEHIPTGEVLPVTGTPFDFRTEHSIGSRLADVGGPEPRGYDHNMVLWGFDGEQAANRTQDCVVFPE